MGNFPDILKVVRMVPLFKKFDTAVVNNYKPITVISFMSKLFERLMRKRLNFFIENNNILAENQFGFIKGLSTNNAVDSINHECLVTVFLDLCKAFDNVNHSILILSKMSHYDVRSVVAEW